MTCWDKYFRGFVLANSIAAVRIISRLVFMPPGLFRVIYLPTRFDLFGLDSHLCDGMVYCFT
jgi:hypothetical protein